MIKDLLQNPSNVILYYDGKECTHPDWEKILNILDYAYVVPSFKEIEPTPKTEIIQKGIWLELDMGKEIKHDDYNFEKLLIPIKPKYTWLTCIRYYDSNYQGKCFNINLSINTTELYKYLVDLTKN